MITFVLFLSTVVLSTVLGRSQRRVNRLERLFRRVRRQKLQRASDLETTRRALNDARSMYLGAATERDAAVAAREAREVRAESEAFAAAARSPSVDVRPDEQVRRDTAVAVLRSGTAFGLIVGAGVPRDARHCIAVRWGAA